jgi:sugar phosphate isomerase/epimerase
MVDQRHIERRKFIRKTGVGLGVLSLAGVSMLGCKGKTEKTQNAEEKPEDTPSEKPFKGELKISLAQWSHHREFNSGVLDPLNFALVARGYGIHAIEYVNQFYKGKAQDKATLNELNLRAEDNGIKQLLIMVDGEGELAASNQAVRIKAVENHYKWVEAAAQLGCHSIRVNVFGDGGADVMQLSAVDGLGRLAEFATDFNINIIVENHGGLSSNGGWLAGVMRQVNKENVGTLPDFGNFCLKRDDGANCVDEYDKYLGVEQLMPYAKAVSAKSYDFVQFGTEKTINYERMIEIV